METILREKAEKYVRLSDHDVKLRFVEGTEFLIVGRKSGGLRLKRIERAVVTFWPIFVKRLGAVVPSAVILDFDAPLGGGPFEDFVIGVFSSNAVSEEHQALIKATMGWEGRSSTWEYVDEHYKEFPSPIDAYANDMVIHELGHLYFGWGALRAPQSQDDWWFSFGAGLLFDRLIWDEKYKSQSPLFKAVTEMWTQEFSQRKDVDQRLVRPDTSNDAKVGLNRLQTFGHGKAFVYLTALRKEIGEEAFGAAVQKLLHEPIPQISEYDFFISRLDPKLAPRIQSIEAEYGVR